MDSNTGYLCPYCGNSTTAVRNTSSYCDNIMRIRTCCFCGEQHQTVETAIDIAGLVREERSKKHPQNSGE